MECIFCGVDFVEEDVGSNIDKKAVTIGRKIVCMNCLRSLNILLKQIEIEAKTSKL